MGAALDIERDSLIGQVLDERYEVLDLLGEGGMGLVYRARHVFSGGEVAVKVLRAAALSIPGVLQRVEREAIAASSIGDAHIVDVRDFGTMPSGEPYMVMELLDGKELADLIFDEPELPIERVCHIVDQVARALAAAHEIGIVHRDLKSENVLLVERPNTPDFVKLVDFGIAHVQNENSKITRAGELLGTPQYMSPEQCAGRPVDHRTDIYALGVLLYEMLTGVVPFETEDLRALLYAHMVTAPSPPGLLRADVPAALDAVVLRCLEKSPADRFSSMDEVSRALAEVPGYTPRGRYSEREVSESLRLMPVTAPSLPPVPAPSLPPTHPTMPMQGPAPRRWPIWLAVAGAVLGLGGVAWVGANVVTSDAPPEVSVRPVAEEPVTPETATPGAMLPAQAAPETERPSDSLASATIALDSVEGASVQIDGVLVGTVPIAVPRPDGAERFVVTVSRDGYEPRRVALSQLTSDSFFVPLEPVEAVRASRRSAHAADPEPQPAAVPPANVEAVDAPEPAVTQAPEPEGPTRRRPFLNPWD